MARKPLVIGQQIWIETFQMFWRTDNRERTITEYEVVEVNKSSAYAVRLTRMEEYEADIRKNSFMRQRIEQRSHKVKGDGFGDTHRLWLTKESFEANVKYNKDVSTARKKAHEIVDHMTLAGLENLINKFE